MNAMSSPKIAIVGRPNVGKSALFNRICGKRTAIVDEVEGITRDRNYAPATFARWHFILIDTAGMHPESTQELRSEVLMQTQLAIEEADALIMVVDVTTGITLLDGQVARQLRGLKKPVCLAVNKVDHPGLEAQGAAFHSLGIDSLTCISVSHGYQIAELLECVLHPFTQGVPEVTESSISVAFLGKPNVGKSTLVNALLGDARCIVSQTPGTTRDALDCQFTFGEQAFTLIDTAGIRRKHREKELVEKLAAMRAEAALERCQVVVLVLDSTRGLTIEEKRLARKIETNGKGCVLFLNKWDLVHDVPMESALRALHLEAPYLSHCPTIFGSALKGRNVAKIMQLVIDIDTRLQHRIPTGPLNRFVEGVLTTHQPPAIQGKRLRIYYAAQVHARPPTFILFVNQPRLLSNTWKRYFIHKLRAAFDLEGVPLRVFTRGKPK